MKRILFIGKRHYTNRDALTERYGRIYQLPLHWSQQGFDVTLWLIDYHGKDYIEMQDDALRVVSTPVRRWAVLRKLMQAWSRRRATSPDLVVASGDCYIGLLGYRLARRHGVRFVFDVYDKYDEFGAYRWLPGFDPFRFLLARSDWRLFASRALLQLSSRYEKRNILIPNGIDTSLFRRMNKNECRDELGLPKTSLIVGYFGSMEPDRGVSELITAVKLLKREGLNIELLLGGHLDNSLQFNHEDVRYIGNVPYRTMPITLAACDILAIPYRRSRLMDAGSSNKIAESIASGRPLAITDTPNFTTNFPEQAMQLEGRLAASGDPIDLARVIRLQLSNPVLTSMPDNMAWAKIAEKSMHALSLIQ